MTTAKWTWMSNSHCPNPQQKNDLKAVKMTTAKWAWMSNSPCPNPQQKNDFKAVKMTTAKWTWMSNSHCPNPQQKNDFKAVKMTTARFNEKGCLQVWGWRCSTKLITLLITSRVSFSHKRIVWVSCVIIWWFWQEKQMHCFLKFLKKL